MSDDERCVGEPGCERAIEIKSRKLCNAHYSRLRRRGTTEKYVPNRIPIEERFWSKVDKDGPVPRHAPELGPCWTFTGHGDGRGHGRFWDGTYLRSGRPRAISAQRWVFETYVKDPGSQQVVRLCGTADCVRLTHLTLGTPSDSSAVSRILGRRLLGEKHNTAKLTEEQVLDIRDEWSNGRTMVSLAKEYGVSHQTVGDIVNRKTWTHI